MEQELRIIENVSLREFTTLHLGGPAKLLVRAACDSHVIEAACLADQKKLPLAILSGGSNVVISDKGFDGLVILLETKGRRVLEEDSTGVTIEVSAGEDWDSFVDWCVGFKWWGVENMSLIPGKVGATPIQNVGAYGQEIADVLQSVIAWDRQARRTVTLTPSQCEFGYRSSIFNSNAKNRYIILRVVLRLRKNGRPKLSHEVLKRKIQSKKTGLRSRLLNALRRRLPSMNRVWARLEPSTSIRTIRECVIEIRSDGRLPDPAVHGNVGSFFRHNQLSCAEFDELLGRIAESFDQAKVQKVSGYRGRYGSDSIVKVPTGVLLNICDLTDVRFGGASLYEKESNIVINHSGTAQATEVMTLMQIIRSSIFNRTGVVLLPEPTFLGFTDEEIAKYFSLECSTQNRIVAEKRVLVAGI